MEYEVEGARLR